MMLYAHNFYIRATALCCCTMIAILISSSFVAALPNPVLPVRRSQSRSRSRSFAPGPAVVTSPDSDSGDHGLRHKQVLVLGGGVAGVLAARKLIRDEGIVEVLVVEARDELGGRMRSTTFGQHGAGGGGPFTVELGANWIQGTTEGDGPVNPILVLAEKYGVQTVESDYYTSISASRRPSVLLFFFGGGGEI